MRVCCSANVCRIASSGMKGVCEKHHFILKRTAMPHKPKMTPAEAQKDHREMLRFLAINAVFGIFIGLVLTAALLYFDIGSFWTRVQHSSMPGIAILLVAGPLSLLLGGASMSTAIMLMPYEKKYDE